MRTVRRLAITGATVLVLGAAACTSATAPTKLGPLSPPATPPTSTWTPHTGVPTDDPANTAESASSASALVSKATSSSEPDGHPPQTSRSTPTTTGASVPASSADPASTVTVPSTGATSPTGPTGPTTSTATTTTSYSTTVTLPTGADTIHPTNKEPPPRKPPPSARSHDAKGASAFAAWYERWLVYGYVAKTATPLIKYSNDCAQCNEVIGYVREAIKQNQLYTGDLDASRAVKVDSYEGPSADIIVKWANKGYTITARDGSDVFSFDGGVGYYLMTVVWRNHMWSTKQIAMLDL